MLYKLRTPVNKSNAIVDLKGDTKKAVGFFIFDRDNGKFLEFTNLSFNTQNGYTSENLKLSDYLQASSNFIILSVKAVKILERDIENDVIFYPCEVFCEQKIFSFKVGKIKTFRSLVNKEKSRYRKLTDGREVLMSPVFHKVRDDFYIAKDNTYKHIYAVSDKFKNLIESYDLNIKFTELPS